MTKKSASGAEPIRFLSAVLITSKDPDRLATFYRDTLGIGLVAERHGEGPAHWACELGDIHFAIHPGAGPSGPGPVKLALWVFDLTAFAAHLEDLGVPLEYPITELGSESWVTAVRDPDGNVVELTQMGDSWLWHLADRRRQGSDVTLHLPAQR